jgi:hypothetical protein
MYIFSTKDNQAYLTSPFRGVPDPCEPDPPRSLALEWEAPLFTIVSSGAFHSYLPKTDFPPYLRTVPVLSSRAVGRLRAILENSKELLPIYLSNDKDILYFFNVTREVDAVDMQNSEFMRFSDGGNMQYERLVFDLTRLPDEPVFFKTTQLGPITEVFANESAVGAIKKARLTGHDFQLVR